MKKIVVINKKYEGLKINKNNDEIIILVTSSYSWEELEPSTKRVLKDNTLRKKEEFIPLPDEGVGLPPKTKVSWHEKHATLNHLGGTETWIDIGYGTIADFYSRKREVVSPSSVVYRYPRRDYYLLGCDSPCRAIEINNPLPVFSIGIAGDGSIYGACPLQDTFSIEKVLGIFLPLREKLIFNWLLKKQSKKGGIDTI